MSFTETDPARPRSPASSPAPSDSPLRPHQGRRSPWALVAVLAVLLGAVGLPMHPAVAADATTPAKAAESAPKAPSAKPTPKTVAKASPKAPAKVPPKAPAKAAPAKPAAKASVRPKPGPVAAKPGPVATKPAANMPAVSETAAARTSAAPAPPRGPDPGKAASAAPLGAGPAKAVVAVASSKPPAPAASAVPSTAGVTNLAAWCETVSSHLTGLAQRQCAGSGLQAGDGRSVQGVPLWHRDVMPLHGPARLRVLVLGGIHGDEMASVNVVFDWLERSVKNADEPIHWRMVPLVNPDGLMRKPSTRVNARGVDLNRNFPTPDWNSSAQSYWVSRTGRDPRRFPGPKAMSEPETQWLQKQVDLFKPHLIVSVHAPYGVLDFDGPPPPPDKMGSLHLDQVGIYPGSLGNYGGVVRRVPVVTLELRNAAKVAPLEVAAMWADLLDWIDRRMDNMAQLRSPDEGRGSRTR